MIDCRNCSVLAAISITRPWCISGARSSVSTRMSMISLHRRAARLSLSSYIDIMMQCTKHTCICQQLFSAFLHFFSVLEKKLQKILDIIRVCKYSISISKTQSIIDNRRARECEHSTPSTPPTPRNTADAASDGKTALINLHSFFLPSIGEGRI